MRPELKSPLIIRPPHQPYGQGHGNGYNGDGYGGIGYGSGSYSDGYGDGSGNGYSCHADGRGESTEKLVKGYRSTI